MKGVFKMRFVGLFRYSSVIASQCAHWRGNPRNIPETLRDCHVGLRPPRNDELFGEQFDKSEFTGQKDCNRAGRQRWRVPFP